MTRFRDGGGGLAPPGPRIFLEVFAESFPIPILAMVDTAAPWCIFEESITAKIRDRVDVIQKNVRLHSRLGHFWGILASGGLTLRADEGEDLDIQVLMFLSLDWPGGNFIGYEGFLDRIRFAVDPHRNRFYFAAP
jgi:hypothetical protein